MQLIFCIVDLDKGAQGTLQGPLRVSMQGTAIVTFNNIPECTPGKYSSPFALPSLCSPSPFLTVKPHLQGNNYIIPTALPHPPSSSKGSILPENYFLNLTFENHQSNQKTITCTTRTRNTALFRLINQDALFNNEQRNSSKRSKADIPLTVLLLMLF